MQKYNGQKYLKNELFSSYSDPICKPWIKRICKVWHDICEEGASTCIYYLFRYTALFCTYTFRNISEFFKKDAAFFSSMWRLFVGFRNNPGCSVGTYLYPQLVGLPYKAVAYNNYRYPWSIWQIQLFWER